MSKAIANKSLRARASDSVRDSSGIHNITILSANSSRQISRKGPFQFYPSLPAAGPSVHGPAGESPAPGLGEDREISAAAPHGAIRERVAAGGGVTGGSVTVGEGKLLAAGVAERRVVAVVEGDDIVIGDGEGGGGGGGEDAEGGEVVVEAAGGWAWEIEQNGVGEEVEDAEAVAGDVEEEGGGVEAGEAEGKGN